MNEKTKYYVLLVLAILLVFALLVNLCGATDWLKQTFGPPEDKEELEEEEEEEEQQQEQETEDPLHCSNVRYTKVVDGAKTTWTALGMPESIWIERTQQIAGGYIWKAYWNRDPMGHISPDFNDRFQLNAHIQGLPLSDIHSEQKWWVDCMLSTGHGGIF
jgi:hypothetical protein